MDTSHESEKEHVVKIAIIIGTTRPNRFSPKPAQWVYEAAKRHKDAEFTLIDLAEVKLPLLDEPVPPLMGQFETDHSQAWNKTIAKFDGYILVTGEYNYSIPAVLKNAIDYVSKGWNYKPWSFVSYGAASGGLRAVEHLRGVAAELKVYDLHENISIPNYWGQLGESGEFIPNERQEQDLEVMLKNTIFWSRELKASRERLEKTS